jgi:hypothetical protein
MDHPLFSNFFQLGYVTSDLDRGMDSLRESHGVRAFKIMRDAGNADMKIHIALALVGELMIELIEPAGGNDAFYRDLLPEGFAIRLHHLGYRVRDDAQWDRLQETLARRGYRLPVAGGMAGLLRFAYVDNRSELGHYQEYIYTTAAGEQALFGDIPVS